MERPRQAERFLRPLRLVTVLSLGAVTLALLVGLLVGAPTPASPYTSIPQAGEYRLSSAEKPPPIELNPAITEHVRTTTVTVSTADDEPLMDIWFAAQLPAAESPPIDPAVAYGTLNEGVVLAVMQVHRKHRDYRDQSVPVGTYVARYLRQPDDGNHLGETTYRDFAVLVPASARTAGPQRFDVTLGQALQLNTHPLVWGLWPANFVTSAEQPGIGRVDDDKWAVKLTLPREDGSFLPLALVVVGHERHYD